MESQATIKIRLKISGTHCRSCEILIEEAFMKIPGVQKVEVRFSDGRAKVWMSHAVSLENFKAALNGTEYTVSIWEENAVHSGVLSSGCEIPGKNTKRDYFEIGAILLIFMAGYLIAGELDILPKAALPANMTLGVVFVMGLIAAASSCLAVTGGLLLAIAAKFSERHPDLTGWQKFKPTLAFNLGRVVSYAVLGGAVGALGSLLTFSPRAMGFVTIGVSIIMIAFGFQLLKLFPWMRRLSVPMPKFFARQLQRLSEKSDHPAASFILGAGTFFLPCGFTQSLQLYVLSQGDFASGALIMFVFSLGTLPALLGLSAISSFAKGAFQRYFLKFAGVSVVLLGFFNMNSGLNLTGSPVTLASLILPRQESDVVDSNVKIVDGKQVVNMTIDGLDYYPHQFKVLQGVPVEWNIDGTGSVGCAQVITVPKLGLTEWVNGKKAIAFTPRESGRIRFSCSMGMTTKDSYFEVLPNLGYVLPEAAAAMKKVTSAPDCNPEYADCLPKK